MQDIAACCPPEGRPALRHPAGEFIQRAARQQNVLTAKGFLVPWTIAASAPSPDFSQGSGSLSKLWQNRSRRQDKTDTLCRRSDDAAQPKIIETISLVVRLNGIHSIYGYLWVFFRV